MVEEICLSLPTAIFTFTKLGQLHPLLLRRLYHDVNGKHRKKVRFEFLTLEAVPVQAEWHVYPVYAGLESKIQ